ncbi:RnfABCDGE type electron transport complex subunit B [Pseudomonas putida]|uniref:(4Fe-4S)-binding protein n=1 Tax=Pseudomonas putida TaxID=303 RepID=A0AAD0L3R0_PSEPU|nr:RnfABCDGE type electron transport complex subunit B [Pseudomonas putida]AXA23817.1 (4Fe-4S)-binding protein [Pseudomonas putida]
MNLIHRIDALLPQTQCGKCDHAGCRPYAEGLAAGEAINKCPPGGSETIAALAQLLQVPVIAPAPERRAAPAQVAFIREAECIGCTKCIQACPVDAIVGASKLMHTVIASECTGCDLCLAPCPVDCIELLPLPDNLVPIVGGLAQTDEHLVARSHRRNQARLRHEQRTVRLQREETRRQAERQARVQRITGTQGADQESALKRAKIAAAMSRAQLNAARGALGATADQAQHAPVQRLEAAAQKAQQQLDALLVGPGHAGA